MRAAPPVEAALGSGRAERMLITLLHGLAGALLAVWSALHAEWPVGTLVLAAALMAALLAGMGAMLARRTLPVSPGQLRWDGQAWSMVAAAGVQPLQRLVVALDLGIWVLLRLHPVHGRTAWRVSGAGSARTAWHGLRLALAAHAGAANSADGGGRP
jgi:hypothetical protein